MLASWRGTRFEVVQVLREVCDRALKEPGASDQVLYNRAKVSLPSSLSMLLGLSVLARRGCSSSARCSRRRCRTRRTRSGASSSGAFY